MGLRLTKLTDDELIKKKNIILEEIKTLPTYSIHRKDLLRAIDRIEKERVRRAWKRAYGKKTN